MKRQNGGFSLVELIVVIGIIGVLMGVLLSQFGGATESAKASQCMNNMRSLAVAANNFATSQDDGWFPSATSWKYIRTENGKPVYPTFPGWIAWHGASGKTAKSAGAIVSANENSDETLMWAITNGAIWQAVGKSRTPYTCPVHAMAFKKKNGGRNPGWSYVMNEEFGRTDGGKSLNKNAWHMSLTSKTTSDGRHPPADKILMFAEMQGLEIDSSKEGKGYLPVTPDTSGAGALGDSMLDWNNSEVIGFNHKATGSKTSHKFCGHVAFADGHVEKVFLPKSGSLTELTKWLCLGYEVTFNGSQYEQVAD